MFFRGRFHLAFFAMVFASVAIFGAGCSRTGKVTGKVTLADGKPLTGGTITFHPQGKGVPAVGTVKEDGSYEVLAPTGECKVTIDNRSVGKKAAAPIGSGGGSSSSDAKTGPQMGKGKFGPPDAGDKIKERMKEQGQAPAAGGDSQPGVYVKINAKYYDTETSGLRYTITGGSQTIDIKLD